MRTRSSTLNGQENAIGNLLQDGWEGNKLFLRSSYRDYPRHKARAWSLQQPTLPGRSHGIKDILLLQVLRCVQIYNTCLVCFGSIDHSYVLLPPNQHALRFALVPPSRPVVSTIEPILLCIISIKIDSGRVMQSHAQGKCTAIVISTCERDDLLFNRQNMAASIIYNFR